MQPRFINTYIYPATFLVSVAIFLVHYSISGQAVYGDGIGYYAHVRSWVVDGDWDYSNEYKHIYNHENNNSLTPISADQVQIVATTKDGKAENHYSPGVAVLLLPFYFLAHLISLILNSFGMNISTYGYSDIYQIVTGIGSICYVVAGLWLLEQTLLRISGNSEISKLTIIAVFFATQLLYYGSFDVINSHFASFFLITLFFYILMLKNRSFENIFFLGLVGGFLTVNRLQDGVIALLWPLYELKNEIFTSIKIFLKKTSVFLSGFLLALWPLLYHWHNTFSSIFEQTYLRNVPRDVTTNGIDFLGSFFHPVTGLFIKAPILLVTLIYFVFTIRKKDYTHAILPFIFFLIQYVIITVQGGWFAAAYGGRMYISSLIFFAIVLAELLQQLTAKNKMYSYVFVGFFIVLNFVSFAYFIFIQK